MRDVCPQPPNELKVILLHVKTSFTTFRYAYANLMGIVMKFAMNFNRRFRAAALVTATGLATLISAPAFAADGLYSVQINKTEVLRLPAPASAVIIGNPEIADVSIHSADTVFVVGKGYGETNLLILDKNGNTMMSSDIQVITPQSRNQVRIFNASNNRQTYNCGPSCNPSPTLGDSSDFIDGNTGDSSDPLTNLFAAAANSANSSSNGSRSSIPNPPN